MSPASPDPPQDAGIADVEGATFTTVRRRLPPFHSPGFSPAVYGFGAGGFFLGYVLFEMPSNLILARMGPACVDRPHHDHVGGCGRRRVGAGQILTVARGASCPTLRQQHPTESGATDHVQYDS